MTNPGSDPKPGSRDNGLRCGGYVAAGDLDPRVADAVLDALRTVGIAAYASPTPATNSGYLEQRLPAQLTDRVFVDAEKTVHAMEIFEQEKAESTPAEVTPAESVPTESVAATPVAAPKSDADVDAAWQGLLASLQTPAETATWPSREDVSSDTTVTFDASSLIDESGQGPRDYSLSEPDDDHYVPPRPPPLPKLRPVTLGSIAAIIGGILIFVTGIEGGDLWWLGIIGILGGAASLVWHMQDRAPTDSGWDDGAVV